MKILPYGEDPSLIDSLGPAFVSETGDKTLRVRIKSSAGKLLLCAIDGCTDRDVAQSLRGTELWYDRTLLPDLDVDEGFYHEDLIGLKVVEDGQEIGHVIAVDNFGAGDLLEIKPLSGAEFYYPFEKVISVELSHFIEIKDHRDYAL